MCYETYVRSNANTCNSLSIFISILRSLAFLLRVSLKNCNKSTPLWSVNWSVELSENYKTI